MRSHEHLKRLIPLTGLRHFYSMLRRFESMAFHLQAAQECVRRPDQLADLIARSFAHASLYDNGSESFHSRVGDGCLTVDRLQSDAAANHLLRLVKAGAVVAERSDLEFDYVDYEISPLRTTGSVFENGESGRSSGTGGLDLLLANRVDRVPIVAEIKAETDRNPFLGLLQALTYAVEIGTRTQRARLHRCYPGRFSEGDISPALYLLLIRYPQDRDHVELLNLTDRVARGLALQGGLVGTVVRRIVAMETPLDQGDRAIFTVRFAHETGPSRPNA